MSLLRIPFGDITLVAGAEINGLTRLSLVIHVGHPVDTTPADRAAGPRPLYRIRPRKVGSIVDLQADMQVPLSVTATDEVGNAVDLPADAVVTYTVDDPSVIALTQDGLTANAAATGLLGTANVHVDASFNGRTASGDLQIVVVPGNAERIAIVAGEPSEVTPDA